MMLKVSTLFAMFVWLVATSRTDAAYVVHEFHGSFERGAIGGPVVPLGADFAGVFSFDEDGERIDEPFNGGIRSYYYPVFVSLTVGDETISTSEAQVEVRDAVTLFTDNLLVLAGTEVGAPFSGGLNGNEIRTFAINLGGWRETFSSSDYPLTIDLASFQTGNINLLSGPLGNQTLSSLSLYNGADSLVQFFIGEGRICESPTCAVPEPNATALAVTGLIAVAAVFRRRRSRKRGMECLECAA